MNQSNFIRLSVHTSESDVLTEVFDESRQDGVKFSKLGEMYASGIQTSKHYYSIRTTSTLLIGSI